MIVVPCQYLRAGYAIKNVQGIKTPEVWLPQPHTFYFLGCLGKGLFRPTVIIAICCGPAISGKAKKKNLVIPL